MTINQTHILTVHGRIGDDAFTFSLDYQEITGGSVAPLPPTARLGSAFMLDVMPALRDIIGSDCQLYGLSVRNHPKSIVKAPTSWHYDLVGSGDVTAVQSMPVDGALCIKGYTTTLPRSRYSRCYVRGICENMWNGNQINSAFWLTPLQALLTALNAPVQAAVTGGDSGVFRRTLVYHPDGTPEGTVGTALIASHALTNTPSRQRRGYTTRTGVYSTPGVGTPSSADTFPEVLWEENATQIDEILVPPWVDTEEP